MLHRHKTTCAAVALTSTLLFAMPADAYAGRHGHPIHHHHRHARYAHAGRYFGEPRYAPPAPIGVGLFGTGLFSEQGVFGLGILGF